MYFAELIIVGVLTIVSASTWAYVMTNSLNAVTNIRHRILIALVIAIILTLASIYVVHKAFADDEKPKR